MTLRTGQMICGLVETCNWTIHRTGVAGFSHYGPPRPSFLDL